MLPPPEPRAALPLSGQPPLRHLRAYPALLGFTRRAFGIANKSRSLRPGDFVMLDRIHRIGLCAFLMAWLFAPVAQAELILVSVTASIDTNTSVTGLFESGEEMDADDPPEIERTELDLPINISQSASATITDTAATASGALALEFDSSSIIGSGSFSETVDSTPFSFASAYARSVLSVRFRVGDPTPYTFDGSLSYDAPDDLIAPNSVFISLEQTGGTGTPTNFVEALDSTEPFSFTGVLNPGEYLISLTNAFGGTTLESLFPNLSRAESGSFNYQLTVVPVPAAAWLFLSSLGLLGWLRRRQS